MLERNEVVAKVYYIEGNGSLVSALEYLEELIPCYWDLVPVEMGFIEVRVACFENDVATVEKVFAPLF